VKNYLSRIKRAEEAAAGKCPGDFDTQRLRIFRATRAGALNLPPARPCQLCGKDHTHEDGTPQIRRVVLTVPDDADYAADLGPQGYRETPSWEQDRPAES
jgi:hypothetical protein